MKIGFSFGRCLRDIVKGLVDYDDVFLIVSRTAISDSSYIDDMVEEYLYREDYLMGLDADQCREIALKLFLSGKLYQPRLQGHRVSLVSESALWMDLSPTIMDDSQKSEQVKAAWRNYQLALKMTSLKPFPKPTDNAGRGFAGL